MEEGASVFTNFDTWSNYIPETSFIGRKTLLKKLRRDLCVDRDVRVSYCGLLKTGKTSLMRRFEEQVNKGNTITNGYRCIVVYYPLYILTTSLFVCLIEQIDKTLSDQRIDCTERASMFRDKAMSAKNNSDQAKQMNEYVAALYENGIRIILILDELQYAPESKELSFADFALLHNINCISIAYVGRLPFSKTMSDLSPSVWNSRLTCKQEAILGFDENDMEEYCSIFYEIHGYDITWLLEDLDYYCGRSPFMLACFGDEIMNKLEYDDPGSINRDWLISIYKSLHPWNYQEDVVKQLSLDAYGDMSNLERLRRIAVGPGIGIHEWDLAMMNQLGYITTTDRATYAISPIFEKRLASMPLSGELPTKLVTAETYLRRLIHKKLCDISAAYSFGEPLQTIVGKTAYQWTDIERTILNLELKRIPDNVVERRKIDRPYKLYDANKADKNPPHEKYALWIVTKQSTMPEANIEEVMLLKDRLGLINGYWNYFADYFDGGNRDVWKEKFFLMCVARNPALHAGTLTEQEQIDCERACDDIIRSLSGMGITQEE